MNEIQDPGMTVAAVGLALATPTAGDVERQQRRVTLLESPLSLRKALLPAPTEWVPVRRV